jgi:diguanylate cyclase (GGDEF)-like protein/PAS domain S-box-containing protein
MVALLTSAIGTGAWYWHARNVSDANARFRAVASELEADLTRALTQDGALLAGSAALFRQGTITRTEYSSYLQAVGFGTGRFSEIHGVGLIQSVPGDGLGAFLREMRADGIDVSRVTPSGVRDRYCLGSYADWTDLQASIPLFGYDFCTVPVIHSLLTRATDTGLQQVLPGSRLGPLYASDFVLVQPVYSGSPTSLTAREHEVTGWALAIASGPQLLRSLPLDSAVQFVVTNGPGGGPANDTTLRWPPSTTSGGAWSTIADLHAYGTWSIRLRPAPGFLLGDSLLIGPVGLLIVGLLCVGLLTALLVNLMSARRRALQMVRHATTSLQVSEERYRTLTGSAPIGILEVLPEADVTYVNQRMADICGRDAGTLVGAGWISAVHPDDVAGMLSLIDRIRVDRTTAARTLRILRPDGDLRHVRLSAAPKSQDPATGYVVSVEDISAEVTAHEELAHQALYDSLTGLPNRALFSDRLNFELARRRRDGLPFAVLFLDLDQFKLVNDSLGHEAGDAVLKEMGQRFAGGVRAGETAARFSGDEFVFIIASGGDSREATSVAGRILALVQEPVLCAGRELTVTASIGIAIVADDTDATTLLRDADTAMYHAKEAGRNRYALFNEELHHHSVERLELRADLRLALTRGEFEVFYEPAVDLATEAPMGAEALIRWHHPTRGLVSPLEFIPVAEDSGLIKPIGHWVFEQAVSQLAAWDALATGPHLSVLSVNVSAPQLDDPATAGMVRDVLERYEVDPRRVSIEVTESVVMADSGSTLRTLERFKALGTRVTIDDFGTGYSSLAYLHRLPVTALKIDQSFIARLEGEDDSTPVVRAIVEMGHAMELHVVAEGVSDGRLRSLVCALGCDAAQGSFWARPMPPDEFVDWWENSTSAGGVIRFDGGRGEARIASGTVEAREAISP